MDYSKLIKDLLIKRGLETEAEMDEFLHPSLASFSNPFLLKGMKEAVERIQKAIERNEQVVIYGDYDCDGVSAVSILYLFFKTKGLQAVGFIPSRHTDGYGLSAETVNHIKNTYNPSLVITVDTGISAYREIEIFKSLGVDVIVTDHHEPPEVLPDTIVIDPKIKGQDYPFNGLSGAGVAFKLVEALSDLETALNYADICAISTIGDIVPLMGENRIIVKKGLEKINSKTPRPSIAYIKSRLKLKTLNSTDISFKIVPRLNACGRISKADKCFKFMVSDDPIELEQLYAEIEADNNNRLELSGQIFADVDEFISKINLNDEPAVFIKNENINLGLIGIVASKLVNILNRPVFVFSADEMGNLKASVRSIEGINIFEMLSKHRDLMIDVGGHSLAGGLTISPSNYTDLKTAIMRDLKEVDKRLYKNTSQTLFDAEIGEKDINLKLASMIDELEPFGFMNPRPVFKLKTKTTKYVPMKSIKHFKIELNNNTEVVSFFGEALVPYFKSSSEKELYLNLEVDNFFARPRARATLKHIESKTYVFEDELQFEKAKNIYYASKSLESDNNAKPTGLLNRVNLASIADFNTIIITDKNNLAIKLQGQTGFKIVLEPQASGESVILYNPHRPIDLDKLKMYHEIIVEDNPYLINYLSPLKKTIRILPSTTVQNLSCGLSRDNFKNFYVAITKRLPKIGNNYFEIVELLANETKIAPEYVVATLKVGESLGFYSECNNADELMIKPAPQLTKQTLDKSKLFNILQ